MCHPSPLVGEVLAAARDAGHEGVQKSLHRLRRDFHLPLARAALQQYIRACQVCQRNKTEQLHPAGLLQPLTVPSRAMEDISMDFIEALPKVGGKSVILTVVDSFSKYAHFIPLAHPYTFKSIATTFFSNIVRLHGFPTSIVSDRDVVFTSGFWKALFAAAGTRLHMSSAFHPQSDGKSEVVNRVITMYLHHRGSSKAVAAMVTLGGVLLQHFIPFSFEGYSFQGDLWSGSPSLRDYTSGELRNQAVERQLLDRDQYLLDIRERLLQAAQQYKHYYDDKHRALSFDIGEWVWLRLQHRPAAFLGVGAKGKLAPKSYGPFKVRAKIDVVAYRLELTPRARINNVFHVGVLKKYHGEPPEVPPMLPPLFQGRVHPTPIKALHARIARGVQQVLIQWEGQPASAASWEDVPTFRDRYPGFQLEDELFQNGGGDVMWGQPYRRRPTRAGPAPA